MLQLRDEELSHPLSTFPSRGGNTWRSRNKSCAPCASAWDWPWFSKIREETPELLRCFGCDVSTQNIWLPRLLCVIARAHTYPPLDFLTADMKQCTESAKTQLKNTNMHSWANRQNQTEPCGAARQELQWIITCAKRTVVITTTKKYQRGNTVIWTACPYRSCLWITKAAFLGIWTRCWKRAPTNVTAQQQPNSPASQDASRGLGPSVHETRHGGWVVCSVVQGPRFEYTTHSTGWLCCRAQTPLIHGKVKSAIHPPFAFSSLSVGSLGALSPVKENCSGAFKDTWRTLETCFYCESKKRKRKVIKLKVSWTVLHMFHLETRTRPTTWRWDTVQENLKVPCQTICWIVPPGHE